MRPVRPSVPPPPRRAARRRAAAPLLALALFAGLALLAPAVAAAHAQLEATSPARGAVVKREPAAVSFRFDEPVEGNFGAVRVFDAAGERVDEGDAFHPDGDGSRIGVHLEPGLPKGSYTATYRVVSADGHIVSSGFVFSIGRPGPAPAETVAELTAGSGSGPATEIAFGLARGLQYAATALAVGGLFLFLLALAPALRELGGERGRVRFALSLPWRGKERQEEAAVALLGRLRLLLLSAATIGAVSAAAGIVLEGAEAAGVSGFAALRGTIVRETLETRFGAVWALTALAWLAFGLLAALVLRGAVPSRRTAASRNSSRRGRWEVRAPAAAAALVLPLLLPVLEPALAGHGSTQAPVVLNFAMNAIHVAAISIWVGGLGALLLVLPAATRRLEPAERSRLLAAVVSRFSGIALLAVLAILVTGLIQAYVYVRHLDALLSSGYGRAVLAKVLLLAATIAIAAYNRRRALPRLRRVAAGGEAPGGAGLSLRRALRAELALLLVVLGVTAALASYAPPVSGSSGPFAVETELGPAHLEMTVEPARVGANEVHLYLFDAISGAPFRRAREVTLTASLPDRDISLPLEPRRAGPGHYVAPGAFLNAPGEWRIEVTVRVSAFDEFAKSIEVPVR